MKINMTNCAINIEIELDDDASIYEVANAFRAMAYAVGYDINDIAESIPPVDHECR